MKKKIIILLTLLCMILFVGSTLLICYRYQQSRSTDFIAYIYQDGNLLYEIPLSNVTTPYTLVIEGENQCRNTIEIRSGAIGIISATCPDKICVNQGFIHRSFLPITCLPNHLVIELKKENTLNEPDIITY